MKKVLTLAFEEIHEIVIGSDIDTRQSGSTLTVCLVEGDTLHCANVGDSKAILLWDSKQKFFIKPKEGQMPQSNITILTSPHNPSEFKEKIRIQKAGGEVRAAKVNS